MFVQLVLFHNPEYVVDHWKKNGFLFDEMDYDYFERFSCIVRPSKSPLEIQKLLT